MITWKRARVLVCTTVLAMLMAPLAAAAQTHQTSPGPTSSTARETRRIYTAEFGVANPVGMAVDPARPVFYVLDASDSELVGLTATEDLFGSISLPELPDSNFTFVASGDQIIYVKGDELVGVEAVNSQRSVLSSALDVTGPLGVAHDPTTGSAYVLQTGTPRLVEVRASGQQRNVSIGSLASEDLEGISYNSEDDLFYVISTSEQMLWGLDRSGGIVKTVDLSDVELTGFTGMAFGPSADATDAADNQSLYLSFGSAPVESSLSTESSFTSLSAELQSEQTTTGQIAEVNLDPVTTAALSANAVLINTTLLSNFSPPSPDSAGITYRESDDTLIISDSEVEEMSIYVGVNVFESTRQGVKTGDGDTTAFSNEPTGASYNSNAGYLYFSDDNTDEVTELDPGPDGVVGTADDSWTATSTGAFGSGDAEGVAWDPVSGDLFVIDGVNTQVYRISPGPDGRFDGSGDTGSNWDVGADGLGDPEGIAYNPISDTIIVLDGSSDMVYEYTKTGTLLDSTSIVAAGAVAAAGIVLAPASDGSAEWHMYIVDRGVDNGADPNENDGVMYEMAAGFGSPEPAPQAVDDSATTPEDTPVNIDVLANDSDPDGNLDPSSLSIASGPSNGSAQVQPNNTITYTPGPDYVGTDSFDYQICDLASLCDVATVSITIDAVNDPPNAVDDNYTTSEDTALNVPAPGVLSNDSDGDGGAGSSGSVSIVSVGSTYNTNGNATSTHNIPLPSGLVAGDLLLVVMTIDGTGGASSSSLIEIKDLASATDSTQLWAGYRQIDGSEGPTIPVSTSAENAVGWAMHISGWNGTPPEVSTGAHGIGNSPDSDPLAPSWGSAETLWLTLFTMNGGTTVNTWPANYNEVQRNAGTGGSGSAGGAFATRTLAGASEDPGAFSTSSSNGWVAVTLGVEPAPASDPLTVVANSSPGNGMAVVNPDGSFVYTPDNDFNGSDSFTYDVSDGSDTSTATVNITVDPVNDPPTADAGPDQPAATVGSPATLDGSGSSDIDGDPLTYSWTITSQPAGSGATLDDPGSVSPQFTPDVEGDYVIELVVNDGTVDSAPDTVAVSATGAPNDPPTAVDDSYSTPEDMVLTMNAPGVLGNDSDPNGDPLSVSSHTQTTNGSVSVNPDGSFTYTPNVNFNGSDSFTYDVTDGVDTDTATVSITVDPVNDAPTAVDDSASTNEDSSVNINVLSNDSDVEGSQLDVTNLAQPANGSVSLNPNKTVSYTPDPDFSGVDSFTYTANDGVLDGNVATVTVTVNPVNDPPVGVDDSYTTDEDTPLNVSAPGVLGNDTDVDGDSLSVSGNSQPSNGSVTVNADGSFTYTPNTDFNGSDSFTYDVTDGVDTDTATVSITVDPVNDAPISVDDSASVDEDSSVNINVLSNDSDVEGDSLTVTNLSQPANGSVSLNPNRTVSYTPDPDFNGTDTFTYTASDGVLDGNTATVTLTVNPVNDAPVADAGPDDSGVVGVPVTLDGSGSFDIDGDPLTYSWSFTSQPGGSTAALDDSTAVGPQFTPDAAGDYVIDLVVNDGLVDSVSDSATITVLPEPNNPPVPNNDSYSTSEDTPLSVVAPGVLGNDSDPDGDALSVTSNTQPANGSVTVNADGSFNYTPNPNFNGVDSFTYDVSDGFDTATAAVSITVDPINDPPVAVGDAYSTDEDTPLSVVVPGVLANDSDPDGDSLSVSANTQPSNGSVTVSSDGSFTYTPNADFNGSDSFTYDMSDGTLTDTATVSITVDPINDPPVAIGDSYSTDEDTPITIVAPGVLDNDSDVDGDSLSVSASTQPSNGSVAVNADGSFTYTPAADFNGSDSFTYDVSDGALTDTATVSITVVAVNDPPVAADDSYSTSEGTQLNVSAPGVLGNDTDVDGDSLSVDSNTQPSNGSVTVNSDGSFDYTPDPGYSGPDSFTYDVSDGTVTDTATVSISVGAVNDLPVAVDDSYSTDEDTALNVSAPGVLGNDTDPDGDSLSVSGSTQPSNGSVTVNADGSFTYTPDANFNGSDSFTYDVSDGTLTDTATVTVTVDPVNDVPIADAGPDQSATLGLPVTLDGSGSSDVEGDALTYSWTMTSKPSGSTATLDDPSSVSPQFTPDLEGDYVIELTVNDGTADSGPDSVTVTASENSVDQFAVSEETVLGTTTGDLSLTQASDGVYEQLTEVHSGGRPQNRRSFLEHYWNFDIQRGDSVTLNMDAYHTSNSESDDFAVSYSIDGGLTFEHLFDVTATGSPSSYQASLPEVISGGVIVRVVDTDRTVGNGSTDTLFVDYLAIETINPQEPLPEVTVVATDDMALESNLSDTGVFTISRSDTSSALTVAYQVQGSATPGSDYEALSGSVNFSIGQSDAVVTVTAIDDSDIEGDESVELILTLGFDYQIGVPSSATVVVVDDEVGSEFRAESETTVYGSISQGDFSSTHFKDGVFEVLAEELYAGQKRSRLEHRWTFNISGTAEEFHLWADRTGTVNETFTFSYSTNGGSSWSPLDVTANGSDQVHTLLTPVSGTVIVRVVDNDSSRNEPTIDRIRIDEMIFLSTS